MLPTPVPTRARIAVAAVFFINGAVLSVDGGVVVGT